MYSLVLMTAFASSPSTPEFNGYFRDRWFGNCGGCGCSSTAATFQGCSGCNGCSCNGGLFSGVRSFFNFNGNCCGCAGTQVYAGCCGGSTFYAGCGGYDMGTPYAVPMGASYYAGCIGAMPGTAPMMPGAPPLIPPTNLPGTTPYAQPAPAEVREYSPKNQLPLPGGAAASPNRGTVVVKLPADAKLYAEGRELALASGERSFVTPELPQGREYNYTFRVEYNRAGRMLSESRTIAVSPGKVSALEFADLANSGDAIPKVMPETKPASTTSVTKTEVATERARLMVKVPAGATLYVNDAKQSTTEFRTPPLPGGKEFTYTMKIETTRNGAAESVTQQVKFRAGDSITVDFTNTDYRAATR